MQEKWQIVPLFSVSPLIPFHVGSLAEELLLASGGLPLAVVALAVGGREEFADDAPHVARDVEVGRLLDTLALHHQAETPQSVDDDGMAVLHLARHHRHQLVDDALHLARSERRVLAHLPCQVGCVHFAQLHCLGVILTKRTLRGVLVLL